MATQFTQKHYVAIAKVLAAEVTKYREQPDPQGLAEPSARAVRRTAMSLAVLFHADNPKFDEGRFLKAAGVR